MAIRNFVLGMLVGAALVVPTAMSASSGNAITAFASARSRIEAQVLTSARAVAIGASQWLAHKL
jgi:hypothetical protein